MATINTISINSSFFEVLTVESIYKRRRYRVCDNVLLNVKWYVIMTNVKRSWRNGRRAILRG